VLELGVLRRNIAAMAAAIARHPGVALRPHLKTAKSRDVARLAAPDHGPITVSTLAEARHFAEAAGPTRSTPSASPRGSWTRRRS
jgi:D-serine deaminase-like pyridoxal phosphate-dependent protein